MLFQIENTCEANSQLLDRKNKKKDMSIGGSKCQNNYM